VPSVALLRADPASRLLELVRAQDAQELAQQEVLGVHADVGFKVALPPTGVVLPALEMGTGPLDSSAGIGWSVTLILFQWSRSTT